MSGDKNTRTDRCQSTLCSHWVQGRFSTSQIATRIPWKSQLWRVFRIVYTLIHSILAIQSVLWYGHWNSAVHNKRPGKYANKQDFVNWLHKNGCFACISTWKTVLCDFTEILKLPDENPQDKSDSWGAGSYTYEGEPYYNLIGRNDVSGDTYIDWGWHCRNVEI